MSNECLRSPRHVGAASVPLTARIRDEIACSLLRATFVALTAGTFVAWLASAS